MKGIILLSHGQLAQGMHNTLEMFFDEMQQVKAISLLPEQDLEQFLKQIEASIEEVDSGEGVVIFCDLIFGTPCNMAAKLMADEIYRDKIEIITGMNLPLIMEYMGARQEVNFPDQMIQTAREGIVNFTSFLEKNNEES